MDWQLFCQFKIKIGELQSVFCDTCSSYHSLTYTTLHTTNRLSNMYITIFAQKGWQCRNVSMPWLLHAHAFFCLAISKMKDLHLLEILVCKYEHQNYILCVLPAMYKYIYFHLSCCCNSNMKFITYFSNDTMKKKRKTSNMDHSGFKQWIYTDEHYKTFVRRIHLPAVKSNS